MSKERAHATPIIEEEIPEHPYTEYESHRYWKLLNKGISDLARNKDLIEKTARPYIVGHLCKLLLASPKKRARK